MNDTHRITIDEINDQLDLINAANDTELSHVMEDNLTEMVLRSIANHPDNAQEIAQATLKMFDPRRERGYA